MELDLVRKELDMYDNMIKNMITLRMSLIPIVGDIKKRNNLPLFQKKREDVIYNNIEIFAKENGVSENLLKEIYRNMIANAIKIEEDVVESPDSSIINKNISIPETSKINDNFQKLDKILNKEIPEILSQIRNSSELCDLNLSEKATLYYKNKINL